MKRMNRAFGLSILNMVMAAHIWAQPAALDTVNRLADEGASENAVTRYFFNDVQDSVAYFMQNPNEVSFYTDKEGFNSAAPISIHSSPLCKNIDGIDAQTIALYNSSLPGSSTRQNFWVSVSACLAAHEGAQYWLDNQNFNKPDISSVEHRNYLYGTFQLSTERGRSVDLACQNKWASFVHLDSYSGAPKEYLEQQRKIPSLNDLRRNGVLTPSGDSLAALGNPQKQRFNIMCGVHEIFRASVSGSQRNGEDKCLSPFHKSQNRYGPLKSKSDAFKKCMSKLVIPIMNAGKNTTTIHEAIKNVMSRQGDAASSEDPNHNSSAK